MKTTKMRSGLVLAGVLLTACSQQDAAPPRLNMHNPAADWCLQVNGKLSQSKTDAGTTSYCTLPSGERIEQWALYHRDHPKQAKTN
ncbi:putative hemolysin [Pantoea sp. FN060301]|uniref:putative hemolysin n=1 Tax=Pantoea sp. FN060301 TaxID=3420380 RepID=UPI003D177A6D